MAVLLAAGCGALAAGGRGQDHIIGTAAQRFMLSYSGVFALIALTAAVAAGLVATDNIVMAPGGRVVSQAVHRALSLAAVGFLVTHVLLEILAHRSRAIDAVVPFLASGRTLYLGLGTLASDLVLLILVTGVARRRFAAHWPATWRVIHVSAYLGWPLAILHGLLGGRPAQPYVDWSYGACLAAVALALVIGLVSATRSRAETAPYPVLDRTRFASLPDIPAAAVTAGQQSTWRPVPLPPHRALPRTVQHGGTRYNGPHHGSQHQASPHYASPHHESQRGSFRQQVEPR
jgi:DMSO/TMAO reductase YedYZ heme-binding membrane subunit